MARFGLVDEPAEGDVQAVYDKFRAATGLPRVPNLLKAIGRNPALLRGVFENIRNVVLAGTLPPILKEMICVRVSACNGSDYCVDAHCGALAELGVQQDVIEAIVRDVDSADLPRRTKAMLKFATRIARRPTEVSDAEFDALRQDGMSDRELLEVIGLVASNMMLNTLSSSVRAPKESAS